MTNNYSILKISAILMMAFQLFPQCIWGQSGSWADYQENYTSSKTTITIANAGQLAKLAAVANENADFDGITIKLTADIDLSAHYWVPIGSATSPFFKGTFNGSDHTISGLNINDENLDNAGLFGYANEASISNLTVSAGSIAGDENVGILAGSLISSDVSNCSVSATSINGTRNVSALVGYRDIVSGITSCTVTGTTAVSLANSSDNSSTLGSNQDKPCDVTLTGRTLHKDGKWNTICLPFDYDPAYGVLSGDCVVIYTLTNAVLEDRHLMLYFGDNVAGNGVMRAGVPYIIRWKTTGSDLVDPVFQGVVPRMTDPADYDNGALGEGRVRLRGTFSQQALGADQSILFMGGNNKLYYPVSTTYIGAFRAFFQVGEGAAARQLDDFQFIFDEEETTVISATLNDRCKMTDDKWYTLSGHRIANGQRPTAKGLYIYKGKKEVIK